jgi:1-pyrroline-5-carboxylate dehydrogenase
MKYLETARNSPDARIIAGGHGDKSTGYFIEPTIVLTMDPHFLTMEEEIFAPVLTIYVYPDEQRDETIQALDQTSPYALTGAIFARDRYVINLLTDALADSAGNFLHQQQVLGSRGGPAALWRSQGLRHQRQGRQLPEPDPLDLSPHHQGELHSARGYQVPFP